jgi:hypothetical protein
MRLSAGRRWGVVALLALVLIIARWRTRLEPQQCDLTTYAVIGHELLAGRSLYSDLWDSKPPAIYVTYAAAERVAGYGWTAILLLNILFSVAILLLCYRLGGLWAAFFWTLVSGDLYLEANQPNTELMINACVMAAIACLLIPSKCVVRKGIAAGLLLALACLYKTVAIIPAVLLAAALLQLKSRRTAVALALSGGLVAAGVCAYFAAAGRWTDFWSATVVYNRHLAGQAPFAGYPLHFLKAMASLKFWGTVLPWRAWQPWFLLGGVAAVGCWRGWRRRDARWTLWSFWAGGTLVAIALPGYFFSHYFQLALPVLCLGAAWTLHDLQAGGHGRGVLIAGCLVMVTLGVMERDAIRYSPEEASYLLWGERFIRERAAGLELKTLPSNDVFYQWGTASGLYFYSGRRPPSGVLWHPSVVSGPVSQRLSERLIRDLERTSPAWIVSTQHALIQTPPTSPVFQWMQAHYQPVEGILSNAFFLYKRAPNPLRTAPSDS